MATPSKSKSTVFFPAVIGACLLAAGINLFSLTADAIQLCFDGLLLASGIILLGIAIRMLRKTPEPQIRPASRPRGLFGVPVERRNREAGERRARYSRAAAQITHDRRRRHDRRAA